MLLQEYLSRYNLLYLWVLFRFFFVTDWQKYPIAGSPVMVSDVHSFQPSCVACKSFLGTKEISFCLKQTDIRLGGYIYGSFCFTFSCIQPYFANQNICQYVLIPSRMIISLRTSGQMGVGTFYFPISFFCLGDCRIGMLIPSRFYYHFFFCR